MSSTEELIGRADVNDVEAILAITNTDVDEAIHTVKDNADAIFTWDYEKGKRPALNKLYEKAKHSQWNGETDLDWSTEVDQEEFAKMMMEKPYCPDQRRSGRCDAAFLHPDFNDENRIFIPGATLF